MTRDEVESVLDELIRAHGKSVRAAIDAGCCQTDWDYRKAHEAKDAYNELYEATVVTLTKATTQADSYQSNVSHFLRTR